MRKRIVRYPCLLFDRSWNFRVFEFRSGLAIVDRAAVREGGVGLRLVRELAFRVRFWWRTAVFDRFGQEESTVGAGGLGFRASGAAAEGRQVPSFTGLDGRACGCREASAREI